MASSKIIYHPAETVSSSHFSITPEEEMIFGYQKCFGKTIQWKINFDRRAGRLIPVLWDADAYSVINRPWTEEELIAVSMAAARAVYRFQEMGIDAQYSYAGNNSREKTPEGNILIGRKEPSQCHLHIMLRIPRGSTVFGLNLDGPEVGEEFNLKGQGDASAGFKKAAWNDSDLAIYRNALQNDVFSAISGFTSKLVN
jgi:hypothetical protein